MQTTSVTIKSTGLDALGDNFEKTSNGFIDFLLLDAKGFPFVFLSSGNLHHFWDLERGNPYLITSFPAPGSVTGYQKVTPNPERLIAEQVGGDYIVLTQRPNYRSEAGWRNEAERPGYI